MKYTKRCASNNFINQNKSVLELPCSSNLANLLSTRVIATKHSTSIKRRGAVALLVLGLCESLTNSEV